ncbi:20935_t:CDS:2, partial [Gigaspora margarita]
MAPDRCSICRRLFSHPCGLWLEGPRQKWDDIDGDWLRKGPTKCALKKVVNFDQTSQEYLNNVMRYSQCFQGNFVVDCFGVTRDPNDPPGCYMFVMKLCEENLYQYIDRVRGYIRWGDIVIILRKIIDGLKRIHNNCLYHGNLHGGNLLIENGSEGIVITYYDTEDFRYCCFVITVGVIGESLPSLLVYRRFTVTIDFIERAVGAIE